MRCMWRPSAGLPSGAGPSHMRRREESSCTTGGNHRGLLRRWKSNATPEALNGRSVRRLLVYMRRMRRVLFLLRSRARNGIVKKVFAL